MLKIYIKSSWKFPQGRKGRARRDGLRGRQRDPALLPGAPRPAAAAEGPLGPQFQSRGPEAPPGSPDPTAPLWNSAGGPDVSTKITADAGENKQNILEAEAGEMFWKSLLQNER